MQNSHKICNRSSICTWTVLKNLLKLSGIYRWTINPLPSMLLINLCRICINNVLSLCLKKWNSNLLNFSEKKIFMLDACSFLFISYYFITRSFQFESKPGASCSIKVTFFFLYRLYYKWLETPPLNFNYGLMNFIVARLQIWDNTETSPDDLQDFDQNIMFG